MEECTNLDYINFPKTYVYSWWIPIVDFIAIILSILCILVLLRHPKLFASTTRIWFMAMLVNDILILLIPANDLYAEWYLKESYTKFLYFLFRGHVCQIRFAMINFLTWTSIYYQTGLSIERLFSVVAPLKTRVFLTVHVTRITVLSTTIYTFLISFIINGVSFKKNDPIQNEVPTIKDYMNAVECQRYSKNETNIDWGKFSYNLDLFVFRAIPFIFILISSLIIAFLLRYYRYKRKNLIQNFSGIQRKIVCGSNSRETRASVLLVVMNITTLLTNPLFLIFELWDGQKSEGKKYGNLTNNICLSTVLGDLFNLVIYLNNQTSCIFFILSGSRFRKYMKNLFYCDKNKKDDLIKTHCQSNTIHLNDLKLDN